MTTSKSTVLQNMISVPQSVKDLAGWNCSAGVIKGLDPKKTKGSKQKDIVHQFVNGASYSYGGIIGSPLIGVGFNKVHPLVSIDSIVYGSYAYELAVGSSGINLEIGGTGLFSGEKY